jgi:hypothetical protein
MFWSDLNLSQLLSPGAPSGRLTHLNLNEFEEHLQPYVVTNFLLAIAVTAVMINWLE